MNRRMYACPISAFVGVFVAAAVAGAIPALAQAVYGSVAGTVRDASGAAVPGATVTITSHERGSAVTMTTNASGFYVKGQILPGRYEIRAALSGFKTKVISSVVVSVDTQTLVNLDLDVGEISEELVVAATEGQLLKTDRADVSTTFERKQVTELPVLDRNFTKFLLLVPGTQSLGWQQNAAENPQRSVLTQVNGQSFANIGYQLDGIDNRDAILGLIVVNPPLESIAESKFTSQNYNAEFGQASAGLVSVQTKSGSNDFHGSAYEFLQRDDFQARNPFTQFQRNPLTGKYLPDSSRDQFGGSLGGPIVRNRFFFFGTYERTQADEGRTNLLTVPTPGRARATSASTRPRSTTRRAACRQTSAFPSPATSSRGNGCLPRRLPSSSSFPCPTLRGPPTARATTTCPPAPQLRGRTTSSEGSTAASARASTCSSATASSTAPSTHPSPSGGPGARASLLATASGASRSRGTTASPWASTTPCRLLPCSTSGSDISSTRSTCCPSTTAPARPRRSASRA